MLVVIVALIISSFGFAAYWPHSSVTTGSPNLKHPWAHIPQSHQQQPNTVQTTLTSITNLSMKTDIDIHCSMKASLCFGAVLSVTHLSTAVIMSHICVSLQKQRQHKKTSSHLIGVSNNYQEELS